MDADGHRGLDADAQEALLVVVSRMMVVVVTFFVMVRVKSEMCLSQHMGVGGSVMMMVGFDRLMLIVLLLVGVVLLMMSVMVVDIRTMLFVGRLGR